MNRLQKPTGLHDQFVCIMRLTTKNDDLDFDEAAALLASASGDLLRRFDEQTRRSWWYTPAANLRDRERMVLRTALARPEHAQIILFFEACNENGHVREKALRALRGHTGRLPCAAVLLRAEDWVPPVSTLANDMLLKFAATDQAQYFFECLDLIFALNRKSRFTATWPALEAALLAPSWREQRRQAVERFTGVLRRFALELVLKADADLGLETLLRAISDPSPRVASWALLQAGSHLAGEDLRGVLLRAIDNRMAAVRSDALRQLVAGGFVDARERCLLAAMDRSQAVRGTAFSLLKQHFDLDALALWREKFDAGIQRRELVFAFAELGEAQDLDRLRSQLHVPHARSRAAALRGMARLGAPDLQTALDLGLRDASSLVVGTATLLYARSSAMPVRETLQSALSAAEKPATRARLLGAARLLPKWEQLEYLLANAARWPAAESAALERCLQRWLWAANRAFTEPSAGQRSGLGKTLTALQREMPHPLLDKISLYL